MDTLMVFKWHITVSITYKTANKVYDPTNNSLFLLTGERQRLRWCFSIH